MKERIILIRACKWLASELNMYTFDSSPYYAQLRAAEAASIIMLGYHHYCASVLTQYSFQFYTVVMLGFFRSCIKENNYFKVGSHCGDAACI